MQLHGVSSMDRQEGMIVISLEPLQLSVRKEDKRDAME